MVGRLLVFLQILLLSNPFCGTFMDVANYCAPDSGAEYCDERVCLCVCRCACLSVRDHIFGNARPIFTKFFMHVTYGRGSVLLCRRSDM